MLNFMEGIALDLGTANCEVYVKNKGFVMVKGRDLMTQKETEMKQIRSVIAHSRTDGRKVVAIGQEAYDIIGRTPDDIEVVRPIRLGRIAEENSTRELVSHLIKLASEQSGLRFPWRKGITLPRALLPTMVAVGVPQNSSGYENRNLSEIIRELGGDPYIISEPIAAGFGANLPIGFSKAFAIVDIGGGTTDIAILSQLSKISKSAFCEFSLEVGGDRMDMAITERVKKIHDLEISPRAAEWIKQQMGSVGSPKIIRLEDGSQVSITEVEVKGRNRKTGQSQMVKIGWEEIKECLLPVAKKEIATGLRQYFERLSEPQLHSDIYDSGIWLTGGGSLIHDMDRFLSSELNLRVDQAEDPLGSVINGLEKMMMDPKLLKDYNLVTA